MEKSELMDYYIHPRIMELRFAIFYTRLRREYGYSELINYFSGLAKSFRCDWSVLKGVFDSVVNIKKVRNYNWLRYRQEMIFTCWLQGKGKRETAKDLGLKLQTLYVKKYPYDPEKFATKEWLRDLDKSVILAGIPKYKKELYKFIVGLDGLVGAL